jgi:uncharacterized DUF497 family protein
LGLGHFRPFVFPNLAGAWGRVQNDRFRFHASMATSFLTGLIFVRTLFNKVISYDPVKNAENIAKGRPSFAEVVGFDFDTAQVCIDDRRSYSETRYIAYGCVGHRIHALVFTETFFGIRVISFRKANHREVKKYENAK